MTANYPNVPLLDLKAQYSTIKSQIRAAIDKVLDSQYFILGPEVEALEKELAQYCNCEFSIGVSSGTDALLVAMTALDIGPGDEVITTPFTFFATVGSILRLGATPVLIDIDPVTFNIDASQIQKNITSKTKAIIPVHLFGQCAEMDSILNIAANSRIHVIEDAAQAIGADFQSRRAGSLGTCGCFSFFPSKNLGGAGEGGLITTNDQDLAEKLKIIRNQGSFPKYNHKYVGGNFRLDAIQAAVLRVKLKRLDQWTEARRENAQFYTNALQQRLSDYVTTPEIIRERHVFNQYVLRCKERDSLREFLAQRNISTEIYYPKAMHLQECYPQGVYEKGDFPIAEKACDEVLALPIYPELTVEQKNHVVESIAAFYERA